MHSNNTGRYAMTGRIAHDETVIVIISLSLLHDLASVQH